MRTPDGVREKQRDGGRRVAEALAGGISQIWKDFGRWRSWGFGAAGWEVERTARDYVSGSPGSLDADPKPDFFASFQTAPNRTNYSKPPETLRIRSDLTPWVIK